VSARGAQGACEDRDVGDREHAEKAVRDFAAVYGAKYPKAVAKIIGDQELLVCPLSDYNGPRLTT
jgi:hypothetical protein